MYKKRLLFRRRNGELYEKKERTYCVIRVSRVSVVKGEGGSKWAGWVWTRRKK
jgi:hypothetical protein